MADRQVKVTLTAQVAGYLSGMEAAAAKTRLVGTEAEKLAQKRVAFEALGRSAIVFGAVVAAGVAIAINKFAEFDQAMSNVQAATQASASDMNLLRDAALDAGAATVFTATEAANAIEELGKNGLTTAQILDGGLSGALSLASAGQLEVARAAEIAAITIKQFGLEGSAIPHIADLLAAGAGKAAGDVEDLAQALAQAGLVASQTGLSVEETTGILSAFADAGLVGSDAGTSLKTALQRLTPISDEAQKAMDDLNISAYDSEGAFIGAAAFAGNLQESLSGLTEQQRNAALAQIFGSDAVRAASVLYREGADGIQKYIDQTNESGYAAKVAADRLDNLRGDIEKLGGAFDTALIQTGSSANGVLRDIIQSTTFLVDSVGNLPEPVLGAGLALGVLTSAVALSGGAAFIAIPKYAAFKAQLATMNTTVGSVARSMVGVGTAVAAATLIVGYFVQRQAEAAATTSELKDSLDQTTGALTEYSRELVAKKLAESGAFEAAKLAGYSQKELTDAILEGGDALKQIQGDLTARNNIVDFFNGSGIAASMANDQIGMLADGVVQSQKNFKDQEAAVEGSTNSVEDNENALADLEGRAVTAGTEIQGLADIIRGFGSATLDVRDAQRQFQASIDDAAASLAQNGATLDTNTEAGRANESALDDIASSALEAAGAIYDKTQSEEEATAAVQAGRDALIEQLAQYGIVGPAAEAYADSLGLIPKNIDSYVTLNTTDAQRSLDAFLNQPLNLTAYVRSVGGNEIGGFYQKGVREFANGGTSFPSGVYAGGQNIHKFAETGLPWETYISPKPGHERENIGYALESLARLGYDPAVMGSRGGAVSSSSSTVHMNVTAEDPAASSERVFQRLNAELMKL